MKKLAVLLSGALLLTVFPITPAPATAAVPATFTVDLANQYRPVTHVASGSLYGLAEEGRPADNLIAPTKPKMFTQMAPNGGQLPNGETTPIGDALKVAPIAERNGAQVTIRMPDIYPNFPYQWVSWDDWYQKVDSIVDARLKSGATNIYGYELWNEPDGTWNTGAAGSFNEGWKKTYLRVKAKDKNTKIIGPSITHYNESWLRNFLTYARDNNVLPDIISWHELGAPEGEYLDGPAPQYISNHMKAYRALETELGIKHVPISINEYGVVSEQAVPGNMTRYIAQFERSDVDTANIAFWFRPGRLSNLVTDKGEANGAWWLYKWYGDMSGQMAMTTPANPTALDLDGIASVNNAKQQADVIVGGGNGNRNIVVKGFASLPYFSGNAHVKVESTPWYGVDTAVSQPTNEFEGDFTIENGQISVPLSQLKESSAYRLVITPGKQSSISRYEAENAAIVSANIFNNSNASNRKYVGTIDNQDSSVQFTVNAPVAGNYNLKIGYANGTNAQSTQELSVNNQASTTIQYPTTDGWLSQGNSNTLQTSVSLKAGSNTLKFSKGKTGYAELDYIQLQPVGDFKVRVEAEDAKINDATVSRSSFASNRQFVGKIDNPDSSVSFSVYAPASKTYHMEIGYGNGTTGNSTHNLSVNNQGSTVITYPKTGGWIANLPNVGTRQIMTVPVTLKQGENTIVFKKGTSYAELDYIEVK
ncbi:CBM35 domain-containing protein [Paenibacillus sp. KACC 21273]|uniref:CBM35 domain-containing protein n=1 Tax=Paenibacillus sp. KACC 21273 TaxID=3025665 RepID=UPI002366E641|nr:CBM35 domain-containing protein [Paenibacillus sp. KACC 21273]WDF52746.1 CBM35 domain-containing protein [Paenibacillus sp. KACC 21273]